jgi:hypothetical protein
VLATATNEVIGPARDRMPAILRPQDYELDQSRIRTSFFRPDGRLADFQTREFAANDKDNLLDEIALADPAWQ